MAKKEWIKIDGVTIFSYWRPGAVTISPATYRETEDEKWEREYEQRLKDYEASIYRSSQLSAYAQGGRRPSWL